MPWVYFAASLVGAAAVVNAWRPFRREPLSALSFVLSWVVNEVPLQTIVVQGLCTLAFWWGGAFAAWPGWVGLGVAVVSWAGLVGLAASGARAGVHVARALDGAAGGPLEAPGFDGRPAWNATWRLALAVPLRFRSIRRIKNLDYWGDGIRRHRLDLVVSRRHPPKDAPVLVYVHGGAWVIGEKRQQGIPLLHELAARGWICVAVNYRLSPRATWPDQVVDCKRAVAWVRAHIGEHGGDPSFVAIAGGSAGGHLCALVALTPHERAWQPGFEDADTSVDACVPSYGVFDVTGEAATSGRHGPGLLRLLERRVFKTRKADDPAVFELASPVHRVTPDAPPFFVVAGANDTLVPIEVARAFSARLRAVSRAPVASVELPLAQHAFDVLASLRCRAVTLGVVRFLESARTRKAV